MLLAHRLLGTHVLRRADAHAAFGQSRVAAAALEHQRDPEVGHQRPILVQQDVRRLHVSMHEAMPMRVVERTRDVARDAHRIGDRKLSFAIEAIAQRLALDEGHHVVSDSVRLAGIVQRNDVRVTQRGRRPDLTQEPLGAHALGDILAQYLDGDLPIVPDVAREEDRRHAPLTHLALDRVAIRQ